MNIAIPIKIGQFRFNFIHLIILIAVTASIFALTNLFTTQHIVENTEPLNFTIEDAKELAEEIYDAGAITESVRDLPLSPSLIDKMSKEIARKLAKNADYPGCEVYFLHARLNDIYPVLAYGNVIMGYIELKTGEVWKVGMTKNGEAGRYRTETYYKNSNKGISLSRINLEYKSIFHGTYKQCAILEKLLIYGYPLWSGHIAYSKPPGCKIYR